jgi:hypothetical protein
MREHPKHSGISTQTREKSSGDSSSDDDLGLAIPTWGVVIAVIVIMAILGIFIALFVLVGTADIPALGSGAV